jgi:hypothetical protein
MDDLIFNQNLSYETSSPYPHEQDRRNRASCRFFPESRHVLVVHLYDLHDRRISSSPKKFKKNKGQTTAA